MAKDVVWPRDTGKLWPWLRNFLAASIVIQVLMAAFESYEIFAGIIDANTEASATLMLFGLGSILLTLIWVFVFIVCVVYTLKLTYRMMKNLDAMNAPGERMSPAWAAGWYFIPFANLVMPMRAVKQIWQGTFELSREPDPGDGAIGPWWGLWIVSNILSTISFRLAGQAGGMEEIGPTDPQLYMVSLYVGIASSLLGALGSWFMMKVFGPLATAQDVIVRTRPPEAAQPA